MNSRTKIFAYFMGTRVKILLSRPTQKALLVIATPWSLKTYFKLKKISINDIYLHKAACEESILQRPELDVVLLGRQVGTRGRPCGQQVTCVATGRDANDLQDI